MRRKSVLTALGVSVVASLAIGLPATPANAAGCKAGASGKLNSGVSKAEYTIRANRCSSGAGASYVIAKVWDTKGDNRAADVTIYFYKKTNSTSWSERSVIKVDGGKGDSATNQVYYNASKYHKVRIFTGACNFWGCSSTASTTFKW